jgi:dTMP kinase
MERMIGFELDRIELEHIEFHRRVRDYFLNVAKKETDRYIIIDGCGTPESIQREIREKILSKIEEGKR